MKNLIATVNDLLSDERNAPLIAALKDLSSDERNVLLQVLENSSVTSTPEYAVALQKLREALLEQQPPAPKSVPALATPKSTATLSGRAELSVRCVVTWDLELTLAPFGPGGTVIPIIVRRAMTRVKPAELVLLSCPDAEEPIYFSPEITLGECRGHLAPGLSSWRLEADERVNVENDYHGYSGDNRALEYMKNLIVFEVEPPLEKNQAEIQPASGELLAEFTNMPPFFRYFENKRSSFAFVARYQTDERQNSKEYFVPDVIEIETSSPTVAAEGTILARLERWMRGDLEGYERIGSSTLEEELAHQIEKLVSACDAALTEAQRRLDLLLHKDEPES